MKSFHIVSGVVVATLLASGSAMAQSASGSVNIAATVTATCTINGGAAPGTLATADFSNAGSSLLATAPFAMAALATGDCNTPTHIQLTSANGAAFVGGQTTQATAGGYANFFDYTAVVGFGGVNVTLDTSAQGGAAAAPESVTSATATAGPVNGAISVTLTPVGTPKVQVGTYADVLTIQLTAN